jgi:hypothetical protein
MASPETPPPIMRQSALYLSMKLSFFSLLYVFAFSILTNLYYKLGKKEPFL